VGSRHIAVRPAIGWDGQPLCSVGEVDLDNPDSQLVTDWPICSAVCCQAWATAALATRQERGIAAACSGEPETCSCAVTNQKNCRDTAVAGAWRVGSAPPPAGKAIQFRCAGIRPPSTF